MTNRENAGALGRLQTDQPTSQAAGRAASGGSPGRGAEGEAGPHPELVRVRIRHSGLPALVRRRLVGVEEETVVITRM
jgi:hypothetical protein